MLRAHDYSYLDEELALQIDEPINDTPHDPDLEMAFNDAVGDGMAWYYIDLPQCIAAPFGVSDRDSYHP